MVLSDVSEDLRMQLSVTKGYKIYSIGCAILP